MQTVKALLTIENAFNIGFGILLTQHTYMGKFPNQTNTN